MVLVNLAPHSVHLVVPLLPLVLVVGLLPVVSPLRLHAVLLAKHGVAFQPTVPLALWLLTPAVSQAHSALNLRMPVAHLVEA
jgi:hypothetical protein